MSAQSVSKRKRRRSPSVSTDDETQIDSDTEDSLRKSAFKNNLTKDNVKNIIKKVVGNEHVLAIVKLQEEEEYKKEKNVDTSNNSSDRGEEEEKEEDVTSGPKLTRAKAQALNKKVFNLTPLKGPKGIPEMAVLIREELRSDEEDDEYEPCEDDIHSDDEQNTTISDIDSQPRTPLTPHHHTDDDSAQKYTKDGLFKIPRDRNDSCTSQNEDYIIAQRTRSKVCLTTIPIEAIESTFTPPDIPKDMLDLECDTDIDWVEFLDVLTKPLTNNVKEDDETDPDYVAADRIPVDKEELREVNISKKELNDLIEELLESLTDVDFNEYDILDAVKPKANTKPKKSRADISPSNSNINLSNDTNYKGEKLTGDQIINDSCRTSLKPTSGEQQISQSATFSNCNALMSTISLENVTCIPVDTVTATVIGSSVSSNCGAESMPIAIPTVKLNPFQGAIIKDGVVQLPEYQQIILQVPTIDIIKNKQQQSASAPVLQKYDGFRMRRYQAGLYEHLKHDLPASITFDGETNGFTEFQRNVFAQQLRTHIQFVTQHFLQCYGHPELWRNADKFKGYLTELDELFDANKASALNITNLKEAVVLVNKWEEDLSVPCEENTKLLEFVEGEIFKAKDRMNKNNTYIAKFPHKLLNLVVNSKVFIYPQHLPKIPFRMDLKSNRTDFAPIEDFLIAHALAHFYDEIKTKYCKYGNKTKPKKIPLVMVSRSISKYFFYNEKKSASTYSYITSRKIKKDLLNPIQYYFLHEKPPPFKHVLETIDLNIPPVKRPLGDLPYIWAKLVEKIRAVEHDKLINPTQYNSVKTPAPTQSVAPRIRNTECNIVTSTPNSKYNKLDTSNQQKTNLKPVNLTSELEKSVTPATVIEPLKIRIEYVYENEIIQCNTIQTDLSANASLCNLSAVNTLSHIENDLSHAGSADELLQIKCHSPISICSIEYNKSEENSSQVFSEKSHKSCHCKKSLTETLNRTLEKGQTLLTSYFKKTVKSAPILKTNKLFKTTSNRRRKKSSLKWSTEKHQTLRKAKKIIKKYLKSKKPLLTSKFYRILTKFRSQTSEYRKLFCSKPSLFAVFNCFHTIEIYTSLLIDLKMSATSKRTKNHDEATKKHKHISDENPSDPMPVSEKDSIVTKRGQKGHRTVDNTRLMMLPESREDTNEKDFVFAQNFMDKVEETYLGEDRDDKVTEFENILRSFDPDREKVADLYYKMENLFLPDHPELAELFLSFLLPGEAAQVGKFMEHFMLTNMSSFINKLNIFFNKQPAQIRKILTCLKELSNEDDLKMEQIKIKVLPLLKGNSLLTEWFIQCFPCEQYPDCSINEYENFNLKNAIETIDDTEVYEHIPQNEILPDPIENPCQLRYMNGRIYYGSRILLPAKLSFMAVNSCKQSKSDININKTTVDTQPSSLDLHSDSSSNNYKCVHNIKQFGELKMKEQQRTQYDSDINFHISNDYQDTTEDNLCKVNGSDSVGKNSNSDCIETYNCCDDMTLKAHGIRLNPSAYASYALNSSEILDLLKPSSSIDRLHELGKEFVLKTSPKKQSNRFNATTAQKNQRKSPNSKKNKNKSPTSKKNPSTYVQTNSQAIQTAKKLKKIIYNSSSEDDVKQTKRSTVPTKTQRKKTTVCQKHIIKVDKTEPDVKETDTLSTSNISVTSEIATFWSREEDKLVLEQIKIGFCSEDDLVKTLQSQLPDRSYEAIHDRFQFLMDIIAKLREDT